MLLTILGLAITTIVSIEGTVSSDRPRSLKLFLHLLAISAFSVALASSIHEDREKAADKEEAKHMSERLDAANQQLAAQGTLLQLVNATVGDLGMLKELSGGKTYHVTIATDTSRERLAGYLDRINRQFGGAGKSGLVKILDPKPPSKNYKLVFGSGIDVAAAGVFQQLANTSGFPPPGQPAHIESDDH